MPTDDHRPTDFLDAIGSDLSSTGSIVAGWILVLVGLALVRLVGRKIVRAHPEPLRPAVGADPATCLVGIGAFLFSVTAVSLQLPELVEGTRAAVKVPLLASATAMAMTVLIVVLSLRLRGIGPGVLGLVDRTPLRSIGFAILVYLAIWPAMTGATLLEGGIRTVLGDPAKPQQLVEALATTPGLRTDPTFLLMLGVVIPFLEEVLFRGVLLGCLLRIIPYGPLAIGLATAGFALVHDAGNLPVFVVGAAMGWLYWRTGDLLAPITLHVIHNSLVVWLVVNTGGNS